MSVQKTYSISIKYSRDDAGITHDVRGSDDSFSEKTVSALSESDDEYKELQKIIVKRVASVVPVSQGNVQAQIVGEVSES